MAYDNIRRLLKDGYPWKIKGNGGYTAYLVGVQPLVDHDYEAIYRYPGGDCCHDLESIKAYFTVLEQFPPEDEEQPRPVKYGPYLIETRLKRVTTAPDCGTMGARRKKKGE